MDHAIRLFLKESIDLELNIGDLYQLFSVKFPEDYDFWWKISIEEMNHAALIESINDIFWTDLLPFVSIEKQADDLRKINLIIKDKIENYKLAPPTRLEAFKSAFELENSVGESHFELFMTSISDSPVVKIFQKLNGEDKNHAIRLERYMQTNGIV
ncbi:MAG TPA: hypothetical protein VGK38_06385 [Prolixibacteraceae bacterium]